MTEFNFNFENPFQLGIEVPIKNHKMLLCDRITTITNYVSTSLQIQITTSDSNLIETHFLYSNDLPAAALINTFLLSYEISALPEKEQPKLLQNIIFENITDEDNRGIRYKLGMSVLKTDTSKLYQYISGNKNQIGYNIEMRKNYDKLIIHTIPFYWDNVITTQLTDDYHCKYGIIPADINVISHAKAAYMWNGARCHGSTPPALLDEWTHEIVSDLTDKNTFMVEFMQFRISCWYKFRSSESDDTIKAFVHGKTEDADDYFSVGNSIIRNKSWDMDPTNDGDWHFWEQGFSLVETIDFWDDSIESGTLSCLGGTLYAASIIWTDHEHQNHRIYYNRTDLSKVFYGTITDNDTAAATVTWDGNINPSNTSSYYPYKIYDERYGVDSEKVVNRVEIGFWNYNSTTSAVNCDVRSAIAYPVLEFAPFMDTAQGYFDMEDTPVSFSFDEITYEEDIKNLNGTKTNFNYTDNYKRYSFTAKFENYRTALLEYLLTLQSWNKEGWNIVVRPMCKRLPPVLIGSLEITDITYELWDTGYVNFTLKFIEN